MFGPLLANAQDAPPPGALPVVIVPFFDLLPTAPVFIGYEDRWDVPLDRPDSAAFYSIFRQHTPDSAGCWLHVRQYAVPGRRLVFEGWLRRTYYDGPVRTWHLNGQPYETTEYRSIGGYWEPHGPTEVRYPSGQIQCRGTYKKGRQRAAECFTAQGASVPCPPYWQRARLPDVGEPIAVQRLLQLAYAKQAPQVAVVGHEQPLQIVFRIDSLGYVRNPRVFPASAPAPLRLLALRLIQRLGRYTPGQRHGQACNDNFQGILLFRLHD